MGDMKDREHNTLSGDGLDEELSQIRDAFQQELEEATKRAEQEAEKNAQSGKEEAPPALPTSPVRAEGEAANAAVSAGEQKADSDRAGGDRCFCGVIWRSGFFHRRVAFCPGVTS